MVKILEKESSNYLEDVLLVGNLYIEFSTILFPFFNKKVIVNLKR